MTDSDVEDSSNYDEGKGKQNLAAIMNSRWRSNLFCASAYQEFESSICLLIFHRFVNSDINEFTRRKLHELSKIEHRKQTF
jgi:hypothetical protein